MNQIGIVLILMKATVQRGRQTLCYTDNYLVINALPKRIMQGALRRHLMNLEWEGRSFWSDLYAGFWIMSRNWQVRTRVQSVAERGKKRHKCWEAWGFPRTKRSMWLREGQRSWQFQNFYAILGMWDLIPSMMRRSIITKTTWSDWPYSSKIEAITFELLIFNNHPSTIHYTPCHQKIFLNE